MNNNEQIVFLPYKLLPNNKVEYWADPYLIIIAPITDKDKKMLMIDPAK